MNRLSAKATWLLFIVLINGCRCNFTSSNNFQDVSQAEAVTENFYGLQKLGEYKQAYSLFNEHFLEGMDTAKFVTLIKGFDNKLGAVDSFHLENWQTNVVEGTDPIARYMLVYFVRRKKYTSQETFGLEKVNGQIKIYGYRVESEGFMH